MRVAIFPSDMGGCGWIRLRWPAAAMRSQGYDVTVYEDFPGVWQKGGAGEPDHLVDLQETDFDLAVLQRMYRPEMLAFMRLLQTRGIPVAIDIDDDLMALNPEHPSYRYLYPAWDVLQRAYREADMVTVSTAALAKRYGVHGRVRVVPNGIPRAYLDIQRTATRQVPVVGWTGVASYHPGDLEEVGTAIADLVSSGAASFAAIGGQDALDVLGVPNEWWHQGGQLEDFSYSRLYAGFDVAIVPLRPSRFNAGKSWLKGLEAAALGVPFVASPTPEYVRLHELGAGFLAERPRDWRTKLGLLVASADLRAEMAAKGRQVAAMLTTEDFQAPQLWEAWETARRLAGSRGGEAARAYSSATLAG